MIHAFRLLAGTFAMATSVFVADASGAELKVLSAGAMRAALQELAPAFEAASGNKLKIEYSTAGDIEKKVAAGDEIDVAILTKPRLDKLVTEAKIVGGSTQTRESVLRSPAALAACLNSRPNWRVVSGRRLLRPGNSQRCSGARPASYAVGRVFHHCRNRSRTSAGSITCRSLRPFDCTTRMIICSLSMSPARSRTTSPALSPQP